MDDQDFHFFFGGASVWDIVIVYGLLVDQALGLSPSLISRPFPSPPDLRVCLLTVS